MPDEGFHVVARSRTDRAVVDRPPPEVDPEQRNLAPRPVAKHHLYRLCCGKRRLQITGRRAFGPAEYSVLQDYLHYLTSIMSCKMG